MLHPDVQVTNSEVEGKGLRATRLLPKGTVICGPSEGEKQLRLTLRELRALPEEFHHLAYRHGDRYVLDSDGSQYMNHRCDPNAAWLDDYRMVAARDIQPGEEVTFDYATSEVHLWWRPKWVCRCGAACCRGVISGRDCLDPAFQERYRGHLPSWTLRFIERNRGLRGWFYKRLFQATELVRVFTGAPRGNGTPDA